MRRFLNFLLSGALVFLTWFVLSSFTPASESFIQPMFNNFVQLLSQHWAVIALVISEVAALLPGKFSGILETIVIIGNIIFNRKKNNTKN